jgi:hypothetical protein
MNESSWAVLKGWILLKVFKQPVRDMPREQCAHHLTGCYLCPRSRCIGALNDRNDPDLTKPRSSTSGHCIYFSGPNGMVRLRVPMATANAHYARRAAEEHEETPSRFLKAAGYDEDDIPQSGTQI